MVGLLLKFVARLPCNMSRLFSGKNSILRCEKLPYSMKSSRCWSQQPCQRPVMKNTCAFFLNRPRYVLKHGKLYFGVFHCNRRLMSSGVGSTLRRKHRTVLTYVIALAVFTVGLSYAAVPLYRMYCQATGLGGTVKVVDVGDQIETMSRKPERVLTIKFNADTSNTLQWRFKPQQTEIKLVPGETALAFYKAENLTDKAITGISTYNVIPFEAGQYFNKIQCFCFEEQRLNPKEEVDMPVFFYIDPEITEDANLAKVDTITLSYTFFEAKDGNAVALQAQSYATHRR